MKRGGNLIWILVIISIQLLPAQFRLEKLGPEINSSLYDEISPVVSRDGRTLYFTRTGAPDFHRSLIQEEVDLSKTLSESEYFQVLKNVYSEIANNRIESPASSSINQDIWIADSRNRQFDRIFHPGFPINNALPNSICSLSPNEGTMVIINHFARDGSMFKGFSFIDRKTDGSFTFPDPIYVHDFYSNSPEVNLCMSRDGDVVILSLNRKDSQGENDLYVSFKLKYNLWSEPVNLGPVVNSKFRDLTPFISEDKSRLFFASNRPGGHGGSDIYMTRRLDYTWSSWTKPELLISPVNSGYDDSSPVVIDPFLYFTSKRDGTSDIFRIDYQFQPPVLKIAQPIVLRGSIRNSITRELMEANLLFGLSRLATPDQLYTSSDGRFEIKLDKSDSYRLLPQKKGFIGKGQLVDVAILDQSNARSYEIDFYLSPLEVNQKIEINNLYFERGKPNLLPVSYPELDRLAELLDQNPGIHIRVEGHTDSVGKYYELLDLSRSRADSIKKYLVDQGVVSARITTAGYGGTRPISENNTEDNRALNRRVEIIITHSELASKNQYKNLPEPSVRKTPEPPTIWVDTLSAPLVVQPAVPLQNSKEPVFPQTNPAESGILSDPSEKAINRIYFLPNELAIEDSSFVKIRSLIDFLIANPATKIILKGMCNATETIPDPVTFAKQRAMGVKEFLIFKSIAPGRISIANLYEPDQQEMSGVKVIILY